MAHKLMNDNAMFYVGQTPWHGLGEKLEIAPNTEEALKLAKLDWQVYKDETHVNVPMKRIAEFPKAKYLSFMNATQTSVGTKHCCTYRIDQSKKGSEKVIVLGHVSKRYEVLQNHDAFQPFDEVLLDHGYTYETAGAVCNGEKIWILAKAPDSLKVGNDQIDQYVLLFNSHNGSSGVTMKPTIVRVVCNNTLEFSLGDSCPKISLRHTVGVKDRLDQMTNALKSVEGDIGKAIEVMHRLMEVEIHSETLDKYLETTFPSLVYRDNQKISPLTGRKIPDFATPQYKLLINNFYNGKGNHGTTLWDAYNAVTEYVDHQKTYSNPIKSIGFGWGKTTKERAFKVARDFANA
jgi:phage/plasmid-like protein (TIGR03299 family)